MTDYTIDEEFEIREQYKKQFGVKQIPIDLMTVQSSRKIFPSTDDLKEAIKTHKPINIDPIPEEDSYDF